MNPDLTKRIIDLLTRHMSQSDRRGYIDPWCIDYPTLYGKIDWSGAPRDFTVELVNRLNIYGTLPNGIHALAMLLQTVRTGVGLEDQAEIDAILLSMQKINHSPENSISRPIPPRSLCDPYFTGRNYLLKKLDQALQLGKMVALWGPGGIGKTALAMEVIHNMMEPERFPDGVLFHSFYDEPETDRALGNLLRQLGVPIQPPLQECTRHALQNRQLLLVLDGAEDAADLQAILALRANCGVLITTRQRRDTRRCVKLEIEPLDDVEAVTLLQQLINTDYCNDETAHAICRRVGNLPLAVQLAGSYMFESGRLGHQFLKWLQQTPLEVLDQGQRRQESVPILLERSLKQVNEGSRQVLALMGQLALAPVNSKLLASALEQETNQIHQSFDELVNYNLLRSDVDGRYRVSHALIYTYALQRLTVTTTNLERLGIAYVNFVKVQDSLGQDGHGHLATEKVHIRKLVRQCVDAELWSIVNRLGTRSTPFPMRFMTSIT